MLCNDAQFKTSSIFAERSQIRIYRRSRLPLTLHWSDIDVRDRHVRPPYRQELAQTRKVLAMPLFHLLLFNLPVWLMGVGS